MALTEKLKKNEIHGGTCSSGESLITKDVHVGDLVELLVDGKFFQRNDGMDERYAGYITFISHSVLGLSPTHADNNYHGYTSGENKLQKRISVSIETYHVKKYRIIEGLN